MKAYYKISEISALYDIGPDSLRYYEEKGILAPKRDTNGYRLYSLHDIWKLNVIKDLRELDFSMKRIKNYLDNRTLATTQGLLEEEEQIIAEKIAQLQKMGQNIAQRRQAITRALAEPLGEMRWQTFAARPCCRIQENVSLDEEVDFLIKKLQKEHENKLYIIGNSRIGAFLDGAYWPRGIYNQYSSVFIIDDAQDYGAVLPAGTYLTLVYRGGYGQTGLYLKQMLEYVRSQGFEISGEPLELYLVDIHETSRREEFLTELQIAVVKKM